MEYESKYPAPPSPGFVDPRKTEGELLFPERFPRNVVERDKKILGNAAAGQFQQRPAPPGGAEFQPDLIEIVDAIPAGVVQWARGWDLAATEGAGDYTTGVKIGKLLDGRFIVAGVKREQFGTTKRDQLINATAAGDVMGMCKQSLPQDPGQAGKGQVAALTAMLAGHNVHSSPETGDKVVRARPFASQVNGGNVLMLRGPWNTAYIDELRVFPNGRYDDQVDGSSRAFNALIGQQVGVFA